MLGQITHWVPAMMAALLLFTIATAITNGSRANWLTVAVVALLLALLLIRRAHAARRDRQP